MLGLNAINPFLLWGTLLVSVPIVIHLLSKRKFRLVQWAAMEFLLQADKKNRRRVQLENLLLLILRCLAVILAAMLVSRPFFTPTGLGALAAQGARFERVIIFDDSPSMAVQLGTRTAMDEAREGVLNFVQQLAEQRGGDSLTFLTTSDPSRPFPNGRPINADTVTELRTVLQKLEVSDKPASLDAALLEVEASLLAGADLSNAIIYLVTDLRAVDWLSETPSAAAAARGDMAAEQGITALVRRLSKSVGGFVLVDVGGSDLDNLTIADVQPLDKTIVAGLDSKFEVTVLNHGMSEVRDVPITFTVGNAVAMTSRIERIGTGADNRASVIFDFRFQDVGHTPVTVEIGPDVLVKDNVRYFSADVREAVKVLLVDGNPSGEWGRGEAFMLKFALSPFASSQETRSSSGVDVEVISENQLESQDLEKFQLVALCNVYRVSEAAAGQLERWVSEGGGLIIGLGDQVSEASYNQLLYKDGAGLLPMELGPMPSEGDAAEVANFEVAQPNHPVNLAFVEELSVLASFVKVYRWFSGEIHEPLLADGQAAVLLRLTGPAEGAPALIERRFGKGTVLTYTFPLSYTWSNWPSEESFLITAQELVRYAARRITGSTTAIVGTELRHPVDTTRYTLEARAAKPGRDATTLQATPLEDGKRMAFQLTRDDVDTVGFYNLTLTRYTGEQDTVSFAVNLDPTEGDLAPLERTTLKNRLGDANVEIVDGQATLSQGSQAGRREFWQTLLIALLVVLAVEQGLAWFFGTRR